MRLFNRVTIIGVGLIGGSIGLAIRKKGLAKEVIGVFRRSSTAKKALRCKAVDCAVMNVALGVRDADMVILATPVRSIPVIGREVIANAKKGAIMTDVGSTKKWIVESIEKDLRHSPSVSFAGSHPMAGSEHAGVEFAKDDLLEGSPCIVTRTKRTRSAALKKIVKFWEALGAKVKVMDPASHDRSVSLISHLPHIVAFSLAGAVPIKELPYAAEGFKDTTRIASSDSELWTDIFMTNRKEILRSMWMFEGYYKKMAGALSKGKCRKMIALLKMAKSKRDLLNYAKKG